MDFFIKRLNIPEPAFDFQDYKNHSKSFDSLLKLNIVKQSKILTEIECDLCLDVHTVTPIKKTENEYIIICNGKSRIVNPTELQVWSINEGTLYENVKSKKPIIPLDVFESTLFGKKEDPNFHIVKEGRGYRYNGVFLKLTEKNEARIVFDCLYELAPKGGEVTFAKLISKVKERIPKVKRFDTKEAKKFLHRKLTDKSNGFLGVKGVKKIEFNGQQLIRAIPEVGFYFNNNKNS